MSLETFKKDGTAQGVAKQRFIESLAGSNKRVVFDPYAQYFVSGAALIKLIGFKFNHWITKKMAPGFHEHLIARTRFIDDLIEFEASKGMQQYVILGAGYDLRAHRLQLPKDLIIFEVDQKEVQNRKRQKLPKAIPNLCKVNYVSLDFNHQSLQQQLLEAGFNPNKSTVFTLEGVSQYITKPALHSTIDQVSRLTHDSRTVLYMSYVDLALKTKPTSCFGKGYRHAKSISKTIMNLSERAGEPWISLYSSQELYTLLTKHEFTVVQNKVLKDLNSKYFKPVGRELPENELFNLEHSIVAVKT